MGERRYQDVGGEKLGKETTWMNRAQMGESY
jgi:hypothetical protein